MHSGVVGARFWRLKLANWWYADLQVYPLNIDKFPFHCLDYGSNIICVRKGCVDEKTDFHEDSTSNEHRILFELLYITVHYCHESLLS